MKKIQCEVCGSHEVRKVGDDLFQCQYCGVQYSNSELKKLLVEVVGEVEIDKTKETQNALKLAYDAYNGQNYQQAYSYFSIALQNDYNNPDATFMKGLSSAYQSTLAQPRATELVQSASSALQLVSASARYNVLDLAIFREKIAREITSFVISYQNLSQKHYQAFSEVDTSAKEYLERTYLMATTLHFAGNLVDEPTLDAYPEAENIYKGIGRIGREIAATAKLSIRYKSGSYKDSSLWDGSTVYRDTYDTAALNAEQLSVVDSYDRFFQGIDATLARRSKAKEDRYYEEHPEELPAFQEKKQQAEEMARQAEEQDREEARRAKIASSNKLIRAAIILFMLPIALIIIIGAAKDALDAAFAIMFTGPALFIEMIFWIPALIVLINGIKKRNA
jgi:hypothetical protein